MHRRMFALVTAAAIAASSTAPMAQSLGMGYDMLTGAVYNMLRARKLPTDRLEEMSLQEIAEIKGVLDGNDSEGQKTQRIRQILEDETP